MADEEKNEQNEEQAPEETPAEEPQAEETQAEELGRGGPCGRDRCRRGGAEGG